MTTPSYTLAQVGQLSDADIAVILKTQSMAPSQHPVYDRALAAVILCDTGHLNDRGTYLVKHHTWLQNMATVTDFDEGCRLVQQPCLLKIAVLMTLMATIDNEVCLYPQDDCAILTELLTRGLVHTDIGIVSSPARWRFVGAMWDEAIGTLHTMDLLHDIPRTKDNDQFTGYLDRKFCDEYPEFRVELKAAVKALPVETKLVDALRVCTNTAWLHGLTLDAKFAADMITLTLPPVTLHADVMVRHLLQQLTHEEKDKPTFAELAPITQWYYLYTIWDIFQTITVKPEEQAQLDTAVKQVGCTALLESEVDISAIPLLPDVASIVRSYLIPPRELVMARLRARFTLPEHLGVVSARTQQRITLAAGLL